MASEQLKTVLELVGSADLGTLTLLRGLPPVLIQAGGAEILRDDSVRFAAAAQAAEVDVAAQAAGVDVTAQAAGVDVTLEIWAEMPHVWYAFAGLLPDADQAVERIGRWPREDRPPGDGAPSNPSMPLNSTLGCPGPRRRADRDWRAPAPPGGQGLASHPVKVT